MARKRTAKQLPVQTVESIESLARLLRKILEIHDRTAPNILLCFEQLKRLFPRLMLRVVPDSSLAQPARANPRKWTIRIRQSLYEDLLRGGSVARWTLCHEIAHVLRGHPGMPFREQTAEKRKGWKEREANVFVREFLIPRHLSAKYDTNEDLSRIFQVSLNSAEIARLDRERDGRGISSSSPDIRKAASAARQKLAYYSSIEDQAAAINYAIFQTIGEARVRSIPAESFKDNPLSTSILTAVGSQLLLKAYCSFPRSIGANNFRREAVLVAAIRYMRPIREIGETKCSRDIFLLNRHCAQTAVARLLGGISANNYTELPDPDDPTSFESSYLISLLELGEEKIQDSKTILAIPDLPNYEAYNASNDIHWGDIHYIEKLMNALASLSVPRRGVATSDG